MKFDVVNLSPYKSRKERTRNENSLESSNEQAISYKYKQFIARPHSRSKTYVRTNLYGDGAKKVKPMGEQATSRGEAQVKQ